jgi:hypothetical protein
MTAQILKLAGRRFVILEEARFRKLMETERQMSRITRQDRGDIAESKRRLTERGASVSWKRIKSERTGRGSKRVA